MNKLDELKKNALFSSAYAYIIRYNNGLNNPYHNNIHLYGVFIDVIKMCNHYDVNGKEKVSMGLSALFHDFNHNGKIGNDDVNINVSIEGFHKWLSTINEKEKIDIDIDLVEKIIRTTEFPLRPNPDTIEEKIMMDADMLSTYKTNWFDTVIVGLSREYNVTIEKQIDNQIKFVNNLTFYTGYAKNIHDKNKNDLISELNFLKQIFN